MNIEHLYANCTPDEDGSYNEQLAFWVKQLKINRDEINKLNKLKNDPNHHVGHEKSIESGIKTAEWRIKEDKAEIIRVLLGINTNDFVDEFFKCVEL